MTAIPTYNSTNIPSSATKGALYWNSDSKTLHIADGNGDWHTVMESYFNTMGHQSQLSYPNGIYSSGSEYQITTQPDYHFDASHIDGSTPTSLTIGDPIPTWGDCSGNGYDLNQTVVTAQPSYHPLNFKMTGSEKDCEVPAIKSVSDYYPASGLPAVGDDATFFVVQIGLSTAYTSPFGNYTNWISWNVNTKARMFGHGDKTVGSSSAVAGSALRIGRKTGNSVDVWSPMVGNSPISSTATGNSSYGSTILHTYSMYTCEIIMFSDALSITEINTVKNYFVNKYHSACAGWAPLTLTD